LVQTDFIFRNCIDTYNTALTEKLSPINKQNLWDLFLDNVIEIHSSHKSDKDGQVNKDSVKNMIHQTFNEAYTTNFMKKPEHFIFWVRFV